MKKLFDVHYYMAAHLFLPPISTFLPHCFPIKMIHNFSLCAEHAAHLSFHLVDLDSGRNVETDCKTTVLDRKSLKSIVMKWY
jgi:hypothetical protein